MKTKSVLSIVPSILLTFNANAYTVTHAQMPKDYHPTYSSPFDRVRQPTIQELLDTNQQSKEASESVHFFSLALQAWNPSLNPNDVERIINRRIENQGLMKGLIEPALALIDISYAAKRPEFGNMMNPMLKQIVSPLADGLHRQYGLPLDFNGKSFDNVIKLNDRDILSSMQKVLGDDFKKNQQPSTTFRDSSDFMAEALLGKSSFINFASRDQYPNQMRSDDSQQSMDYQPKKHLTSTPRQMNSDDDVSKRGYQGKSDGVSTPRSSNDNLEDRPRGLFSKMDMVSMSGECALKCSIEMLEGARTMAGWGKKNGIWGAIIGAVAGAATGAVICSGSSECNKPEPKKQDPPPKNDPKPTGDPKENPPKTAGGDIPSTPPPKDDTEPTPKSSDPQTPSTPKDPSTIDGDNSDDDDSTKKDETVYTRFLEDKKMPGFDIEKQKKSFKQISTPMRGN